MIAFGMFHGFIWGMSVELALSTRMKPVDLHQLAHALLAGMNTARGEFAPYPRPAIGPFHLGKDRTDMDQKRHVADAPLLA